MPALAEAFREHGFEGASLSMLSKASGLGKGSLYNFFPGGKAEMMDAVLANIDEWFETAIFSPLEAASDPAAAVSTMMEQVSVYFQSGGRVCLVGRVGLSASDHPFAGRVKSYFSRWIAALACCLEAGRVPRPLAEELAEEAVSGIQGAIVLAHSLNEEAAFARIIDRQERTLLAALACG